MISCRALVEKNRGGRGVVDLYKYLKNNRICVQWLVCLENMWLVCL